MRQHSIKCLHVGPKDLFLQCPLYRHAVECDGGWGTYPQQIVISRHPYLSKELKSIERSYTMHITLEMYEKKKQVKIEESDFL